MFWTEWKQEDNMLKTCRMQSKQGLEENLKHYTLVLEKTGLTLGYGMKNYLEEEKIDRDKSVKRQWQGSGERK